MQVPRHAAKCPPNYLLLGAASSSLKPSFIPDSHLVHPCHGIGELGFRLDGDVDYIANANVSKCHQNGCSCFFSFCVQLWFLQVQGFIFLASRNSFWESHSSTLRGRGQQGSHLSYILDAKSRTKSAKTYCLKAQAAETHALFRTRSTTTPRALPHQP